MKICIGSDHAGFPLKREIVEHLVASGHDVDDLGTDGLGSVDYPDFAKQVATRVTSGAAERGILVCGTGQGMAMTANKVPGCRAAVVGDTFSAAAAMEHNDARVLCIGQRVTGPGLARVLVDTWLGATFAGGRHAARVAKIE
ncbi:MAG: ribose 5-phosphate isomerase B [Deltaproteobacteria bacterium]|nr:ribose 5-phosphate isomerase B [Deltaproteobacteria bacterium]